jgi:hypothetical protein
VPDRGPPRGEYSISHLDYHDTLQGGTTHTSYGLSYGSIYPQALQSPSLRPGTPVGYDMAPHASQPPPMGPRPPTEFVPIDSVQSADSPYPLGFARPQSPRHMTLAGPSSEGSAAPWNRLAGSYSHQSTSESHSSYNPGGFRVVHQQNPRPIAVAPPSQGPAGAQDAWVPISQVYFNFTFLRRPLPEDNRTTMTAENSEKRKGLMVCNCQTECRTRILIPMGIEDWDQLLPTSRPRLRVTTRHWGRLCHDKFPQQYGFCLLNRRDGFSDSPSLQPTSDLQPVTSA